MMRQSALLLDNPPPCKQSKPLNNGHNPDNQAMDLDPPFNPDSAANNSWDNMDTTESTNAGQITYDEIVNRAISYGQELNHEFKDETDPAFRDQFKETMKELFGMLAYKDVRTSPAARWLDVSERAKVGEGLNGAILGEYMFSFLYHSLRPREFFPLSSLHAASPSSLTV